MTGGRRTMDNLTREEAASRAQLIPAASYEVALDLTLGEERFSTETTITFAATEPSASTFIDYKGPGISSATLNGRDLDVSAFDGVRLPISGLAASNELHIVADGEYSNAGYGLNRFVDPVDSRVYLHSDFEPYDARRMFPCFDQPDIKGPFTFSVKAPAGFIVLSNYPAVEKPSSGAEGWWRFEKSRPMSTYFTCVVAGEYWSAFDTHRGFDLGWHCRHSHKQYVEPDLHELFEITKQGLDYFEEVFKTPYPFAPKYDQVMVPEFITGAMENVGLITFNEAAVFRSRVTDAARRSRAGTILHELAHMWFGDLVTMKWWEDLWLNESFATLVGNFATARATRFTTQMASFAHTTKTIARAADERPSTHPIVADIPDILAARINFDGITYGKGASVFRQLIAWVGEDAFFEGVKEYFDRYAYANANLGEFLEPLEKASGRDLGDWSKQWLETTGVNTIASEFEVKDGVYSAFRLRQLADPEHPTLRAHRIRIGLYDDGEDGLVRRTQTELDLSGDGVEVGEFIGQPAADLVIPNDDDLSYAKLRLDRGSVETASHSLSRVRDDVARALLWSATFDMVREAALGAREWIRILLNNIDGETEIGVVQSLLLQASSAASSYVHPSARDAARQLLADAAIDHLNTEEAGSDRQRPWAGVLISNARSREQLDLLRGLLDGSVSYPGLQIDVGLRWQLVLSLSARGEIGEKEIEEELARDPTDTGKRHVLAARTLLPVIEAKQEAWRRAVEEPGLPLADLRAIARGFHHIDQAELLAPFADKYFETLEQIWEQREVHVATSFTAGFWPGSLMLRSVAEKAREYLTEKSAPPAVMKVLGDGSYELLRALRAQERDGADTP